MLSTLIDQIMFTIFLVTFGGILIAFIGDIFYEIYEWIAYDLFNKKREIEPIVADWEWEEICERSKR